MGNVSNSTITYTSYTPSGSSESQSITTITKNKPRSRGGGGSSNNPTGGTQIIVDKNTNESKIVASSEENKKIIEEARIKAQQEINKEEIRKQREADLIRTLQRTQEGQTTKTDKGIEIINKDKKITITKSGDIIKTPKSATINPALIKNIKNKKLIYLSNIEDKQKEQEIKYRTPNGSISEYIPEDKTKYELYKKEEELKSFVDSGKGGTSAILLGSAYSGYRYGKGAFLGFTALVRPKFYTEELPGLLQMVGKVATGKGIPEVGKSLRTDPFMVFEVMGYSKGFGYAQSKLTPTIKAGYKAVEGKLFRQPDIVTPKKIPIKGTNIVLEDSFYRQYEPQYTIKKVKLESGNIIGLDVKLKPGQQKFSKTFESPKILKTESGQVAFNIKKNFKLTEDIYIKTLANEPPIKITEVIFSKSTNQLSLKDSIPEASKIGNINFLKQESFNIKKNFKLTEDIYIKTLANEPPLKITEIIFPKNSKATNLNKFGFNDPLTNKVKISLKMKPFPELNPTTPKNNIVEPKSPSGLSNTLIEPSTITKPKSTLSEVTNKKVTFQPDSSRSLFYIDTTRNSDLILIKPTITGENKPIIITDINSRNIIKPTTREESKEIILPKSNTDDKIIISTKSNSRTGQVLIQETKPIQKTTPIQEIIIKPKQDIKQKEEQGLFYVPVSDSLQIQKIKQDSIFNTPKSILRTENIFKSNLFKTQVRRKGKFVNIFETKNLNEAIGIGKKNIASTSSASFKIIDNLGNPVSNLGFLGNQFRRSKIDNNIIVEKRQFRINTPGEKKEITFLGILKNKNKKNIFGGF